MITVSGEEFPVLATLLTGDERSRRLPAALENWPPYATCARRSGRELRLFLLSRFDRGNAEDRHRPGDGAG